MDILKYILLSYFENIYKCIMIIKRKTSVEGNVLFFNECSNSSFTLYNIKLSNSVKIYSIALQVKSLTMIFVLI